MDVIILKENKSIGIVTIIMNFSSYLDMNIFALLLMFLIPFLITIFNLCFWSAIFEYKKQIYGMTKNQLITYMLLVNVFYQQFNVYTPATTALWEGSIVRYYTKPLGLIRQFIYEVIGKSWLPNWLIFSFPTIIIARLLGFHFFVSDFKHFIFFILSFIISIIIGFEIDIIFSAIAIKLKNGCWAAQQIRNILIIMLSGQLIPLQFFPKIIKQILEILPFGSLANAPVSIYIGGEYFYTIGIQCFWAIFMGFLSYIIFKKSEENMISLGG